MNSPSSYLARLHTLWFCTLGFISLFSSTEDIPCRGLDLIYMYIIFTTSEGKIPTLTKVCVQKAYGTPMFLMFFVVIYEASHEITRQ